MIPDCKTVRYADMLNGFMTRHAREGQAAAITAHR